jgi:hypothetical protein
MSTFASEHVQARPAALLTAAEQVESWAGILHMIEDTGPAYEDMAELIALLHLTPRLLQEYPLMKIARKEAAASILHDRISALDDEARSMQKASTSLNGPLLFQQSHYRKLSNALSLEDETMTERILAGDIPLPESRPEPSSIDTWIKGMIQAQNELNEDPILRNQMSKLGF